MGDNIVRLGAARQSRDRPTESIMLTIERFGPGEAPMVTLRGYGSDAGAVPMDRFVRLVSEAVLSIAAGARDQGQLKAPVALGWFWPDGMVTSYIDHDEFDNEARKAWLVKATETLGVSFAGQFAAQVGESTVQ